MSGVPRAAARGYCCNRPSGPERLVARIKEAWDHIPFPFPSPISFLRVLRALRCGNPLNLPDARPQSRETDQGEWGSCGGRVDGTGSGFRVLSPVANIMPSPGGDYLASSTTRTPFSSPGLSAMLCLRVAERQNA